MAGGAGRIFTMVAFCDFTNLRPSVYIQVSWALFSLGLRYFVPMKEPPACIEARV